jgi:hypothetical protein
MIQFTSALIVLVGFVTSFVLVLILNRVHNIPRQNVWNGLAVANYSTPLMALTNVSGESGNSSFRQNTRSAQDLLRVSAGNQSHQIAHAVTAIPTMSATPSAMPRVCNGITVTPTIHNHMLCHAFCAIVKVDDIVHFSGHRIAQVFDTGNKKLHVYIGNEMKARYWGEVAELVSEVWKRTGGHLANATNATSTKGDVGVHIHNYHKLGDFLLLFRDEFFRSHPDRKKFAATGPKAIPLTRAQIHWAADRGQPPVVVTNWGDENWGFLSGRKPILSILLSTIFIPIPYGSFTTVSSFLLRVFQLFWRRCRGEHAHDALAEPHEPPAHPLLRLLYRAQAARLAQGTFISHRSMLMCTTETRCTVHFFCAQIVLVVTNTHVDPQIGNHSKVRVQRLHIALYFSISFSSPLYLTVPVKLMPAHNKESLSPPFAPDSLRSPGTARTRLAVRENAQNGGNDL